MIESELIELTSAVRDEYRSRYPDLSEALLRFNERTYFRENPDVAKGAASTADLIRHFCEFGHRECRRFAEDVTYVSLYAQAFPHLAEKLLIFDPLEYGCANRDVLDARTNTRDIYEHFCRCGAYELRVLRNDGRIADRKYAISQVAVLPVTNDVRAYAHIFFPDAGTALKPYLQNLAALGARVSLSFSDVTFSPYEMETYAVSVSAQGSTAANFLTAPPNGRDWGGLYRLWQQDPPLDESIVFFLHSKKSLHLAPTIGEVWRNELLGPICGSYGAILSAVDKLKSGYSMVASALHRSRNVGLNSTLITELRPLLGLPDDTDNIDFVAGGMFAVRGQVLNVFFNSIATAADFRRSDYRASLFDGSMAHACERLIGYFAASQGKGIAWTV